MSDKTATERLREMLDERGVVYETRDRPEASHADWESWMHGDEHQPNGAIRRETLWGQPVDQHGATLKGVYHAKATEMGDRLLLEAQLVTPEQAIAATVGSGTCEVDASLYWDVNPDDPYWEHELSCGHTVKWDDPKPPKFCPECGKEVKGDNGDDFQDVIY